MARCNRRIFDVVHFVDVADIRPAPENDRVYRPVLESDPEIQRLADSIRENGLLQELVISLDNYILSGHRRFAAAKLAGLEVVSVRYADIRHDTEPELFVELLVEYNLQRVKGIDEQLREAVVDANPEECRAELVRYRRDSAKVEHDRLSIGGVKTRKKISSAKEAFEAAIVRVVNDLGGFWPLSDRQIHYALLNDPPLRHSGKVGSRYRNNKESYRDLTDMLTRMRIDGTIPFHAIGDETRPVDHWDVYRGAGEFVAQELDRFLKGYYRNLIQSQPNHVEVVVEKNTVAGIVRPVCAEFCLPMTSGRGYCSLPPRYDMAQRFRRSGKEKLILLFVSDFDPEGEDIAKSFSRSMRDDFGINAIHPIKIALTGEQVEEYKLPPAMRVKTTSSRAKAFVAKHGENVWELEALRPETLQGIVREAITSVLDMELFGVEQDREANEAKNLRAIRQIVQDNLKDLNLEDMEGTESHE